ncbi:nascent polypeptide-associated complex subunit alpha, muscle-specific form isoform X6 [Polyergus mexicanus]|uniref:nascent polypeptide-associated complex subunit alpha, muscle-specific form isoform X6 n=1 Tax=Polyergus mexicanus TaxID=615972 RepID=UPI0038B4DE51
MRSISLIKFIFFFIFTDRDNLANGSERDSPWSCGGGSGGGRRPLTSIIERLRTSKRRLRNGSEKNGYGTDSGGPFSYHFGEVSGENVSASTGPTRGGDRGEAADLGTHTENNDGATLAANTAVDARGGSPQGAHLSGAATPRPPRSRRRQNQNGLDTTQVKTERLTPDNNSTSSRSVTPSSSSHPGTPPNATPLGGPEGPPPSHHLKHMEQMMGRNYSDFMRSLAAKYNNANPNDYFSTSRNGYPPGLDPRFPAFKTAATPFVGLMAPLGAPQPPTVPTTSPLSNKDPKEQKQDSLFGNPVFPPMIDMSSTQALLHMVRTANAAQNAAELETYLKGANKRDAGVTSPLDLSSPGGFAPRKRQRPETRRSESVSPKPKPIARPITPPPVRCPTLYAHMPCGDGQAVNRWTIEDVVNYVSSIDICAEYAQVSVPSYLPLALSNFN